MPADSLTIAVTTGLGFSVLAGIVSGVCYILTYGLPQARRSRALTPWQCSICGRHFRSIDGVLEVEKVATCAKCGVKACKEKCATREPAQGWLCNNCKPDTWFVSLLNMLQPSTSKGSKKMDQTRIDEIDEDLLSLQKKEREQVRDFIERLVGALLGGDLDDVSVKKVYNDVKYDAIYARYHDDISNALTDLGSALHISIANLPISGQSPCSTHATLKLLIQKFIQEAAELPKLRKFEDHPAIPDDTKDRTYEDLLSTAIINKVIQNSQEGAPSRSVSSRTSSRKRGEKEYFFGERNLDSRRVHDDTSSLSSLDSDTMSLKIHGCIKEVSSSGDETKDEDEFDIIPRKKSSNDWQDNWRLQKRKYDGTTSPVPVPMLVPDPINEAKVLIGDREAEDTTDLSDAASDYEEALEPSTLNSVLINSRTVIGGRSPLESLVSKQESISEDSSTDAMDLAQEKEDILKKFNGEDVDVKEEEIVVEEKIRNEEEVVLQEKDTEDGSLISLDSNTEKDLEYTERYASLPRTIYKSPRLPEKQSHIDDTSFDDLTIGHEHKTDNVDSGVTSDEDEKQRVFKGTYSEREKEKWNHAVPLSNNPYSKSNLERRLSSRSSNSSIGSSFGRDYYIREAAKSAGARKLTRPSSPPISTPQREIEEDDEVKKPEEKIEPLVFKAVPAFVANEPESPIEPPTPTRPNQLDVSSDSDYSIERTYNIETGQVIRKPNSFREYVKDAARSPEGIKYIAKDFDVDENQNKMRNEKRNFLKSLTTPEEEDVSSVLDSSFEEVSPPRVNHFRLVEEIANETSEQYDNTPLSPPAQFSMLCAKMFKPPQGDFDEAKEDSEQDDTKQEQLVVRDYVNTSQTPTGNFNYGNPQIDVVSKITRNVIPEVNTRNIDYTNPLTDEIPKTTRNVECLKPNVESTVSSTRDVNGEELASQKLTRDVTCEKIEANVNQKLTQDVNFEKPVVVDRNVESEKPSTQRLIRSHNSELNPFIVLIDKILKQTKLIIASTNDMFILMIVKDELEKIEPMLRLKIKENKLLIDLESTYIKDDAVLRQKTSNDIECWQQRLDSLNSLIREILNTDDDVPLEQNPTELKAYLEELFYLTKRLRNMLKLVESKDEDALKQKPHERKESLVELYERTKNERYLLIIKRLVDHENTAKYLESMKKTENQKGNGDFEVASKRKIFEQMAANEQKDEVAVKQKPIEQKDELVLKQKPTEQKEEVTLRQRAIEQNDRVVLRQRPIDSKNDLKSHQAINDDLLKQKFSKSIYEDQPLIDLTSTKTHTPELSTNENFVNRQSPKLNSVNNYVLNEKNVGNNFGDISKSEPTNTDQDLLGLHDEDYSTTTTQPNSHSLNEDEVDFITKNMNAFKLKMGAVLNDDLQKEEFSLTYSEVSEPEAELEDLKGKKLVNNLRGEFSKSSPNLSRIPSFRERNFSPSPSSEVSYRSASVDISEVEDDDDLPSVRRLSKIFDSNKNGKQDQVHSLTARSIPKEFRQELKRDPTPAYDVIKEVVSSETPIEEKVLPFPKAKSKIEFFEKLKK